MITILNGLLGATWRAYAQHRTHIAVIETAGLHGLASAMRVRTADERVTINAVLSRLGDLNGTPAFTIETPNIGATVREVLDNDMTLQAMSDLTSTPPRYDWLCRRIREARMAL